MNSSKSRYWTNFSIWRIIAAQALLAASFAQSGPHGGALQILNEHGTNPTHNADRQYLQVTLITDRNSYRLGETIKFTVLLANNSPEAIYLFGNLDWGESASLSLWLKDAVSGKDINADFIADAPSPPPASKDAFIKLLPHHVYGVGLNAKLADLNILKGGKYQLVVEYHSPVPLNMGFGLPIWSREKGSVSSIPVTITVDR